MAILKYAMIMRDKASNNAVSAWGDPACGYGLFRDPGTSWRWLSATPVEAPWSRTYLVGQFSSDETAGMTIEVRNTTVTGTDADAWKNEDRALVGTIDAKSVVDAINGAGAMSAEDAFNKVLRPALFEAADDMIAKYEGGEA